MAAAIQDILTQKGHNVVSVSPQATVKAAAEQMNQAHIGALVILDGDKLVGIFTERDVLRRVVGAGRDPATTLIKDVMTWPIHTCTPQTPLKDCLERMSNNRFRHMPVVDQGKVIGMISTGDILANTLKFQEQMLEHFHEYLHGRR